MRTKTRTIVLIATSAVLLPFAGCHRSEDPGERGWRLDTLFGRSDVAGQKFSSAGTQEPTAVESAIALSDKYAKLSEEASALRQQKQKLDTENQRLKDELQSCRSQLEQTQKDLGEANDLLLEMRVELNNWKNNVLGFRDEMRDAEKAQLEALLKILKLMGGEVNQPGNIPIQTSEEQK
jgi:septal ring factor EnvC (AmiA/AmiB activator)